MSAHNALIKALRQLLPPESLLVSEEERRPYECDGLTAYRQLPFAVVLPDSLQEVQQILRLCKKHNVPVVARGAGTGLSGGALPLADCVLLSMAKFNRIVEIDHINRLARVQPGVRNLAISETVAPLGLYYAPDPSSQIACTIGGNVAENAGGVHCLKYGLTTHNILRVEIVTLDGERLTLGSHALDSPGYDLLALITGSEGLLGVITEVTVKLLAKPPYAQVLLAAYDNLETAGKAVSEIISTDVIPAELEMMDNLAIRASEQYAKVGYPTEAAAILLCELDGDESEVKQQIVDLQHLLEQGGATEVQASSDENQRLLF